MSTKIYWQTENLMKIGSLKAIVYLTAYINFCSSLPISLPDLGDNRHNKFAYSVVQHLFREDRRGGE